MKTLTYVFKHLCQIIQTSIFYKDPVQNLTRNSIHEDGSVYVSAPSSHELGDSVVKARGFKDLKLVA